MLIPVAKRMEMVVLVLLVLFIHQAADLKIMWSVNERSTGNVTTALALMLAYDP